MSQDATDSESKSTIKVVQEVRSPSIPDDACVMTIVINNPPGAPGYPPHRLPGGPGFGYMIEGEMLFELEGDAPRVLRAGDAFWGPGGDVIHYQDDQRSVRMPRVPSQSTGDAQSLSLLKLLFGNPFEHRSPGPRTL
jgi:quercetin dioxygenase-like cupin family protein